MNSKRQAVRRLIVSFAAILLAGAGAADPTAGGADAERRVTVSAGSTDRHGSIVVLPADAVWARPSVRLMADDGPAIPVQVRPDGRAVFVLPHLKAGAVRTYRMEVGKATAAAPPPAAAAVSPVSAERRAGGVAVSAGGRDVLVYRGETVPAPAGFGPEYDRGGYLEPLTTPAGVRVTDDYPPNHKHHHGVWAPWTKTAFEGRKPDFWNMGQKTGTVEFVAVDRTWSGEVAAGFTARHRFVDLSAGAAKAESRGRAGSQSRRRSPPVPPSRLDETWDVQAYAVGGGGGGGGGAKGPAGKDKPPGYHLFDWQSTQTCATASPLKLPKYQYGGLGVRGNRQWDGAENAAFLTSEGKTRTDGNDSPARWVAMSGKVDGQSAHVAVLCHPGNFRSPQPVRLHPKEPFLCYAPQIQGDMAIEPGKPYVARYRFAVGDGEPDKAELNRLWADYADSVKVEVR